MWRKLHLYSDPHLKLLFMSGYAANVIAQRGLMVEDVHFIQKPFSFQKFAAHAYEIPGNDGESSARDH